VSDKVSKGTRFSFITHNTKDFSHPSRDNRLPHPDLSALFSKKITLLHKLGRGVEQD
jgi:hypothetical protein